VRIGRRNGKSLGTNVAVVHRCCRDVVHTTLQEREIVRLYPSQRTRHTEEAVKN
jgi:hypothetical protein